MLSESYAPLFGDLSKKELEKVAEFQADFLEASQEQRVSMVKEALASLIEDDRYFDRFVGAVNYADSHGDYEEKEAVAQLLPIVKEAAFPGDKEYRSGGSMGILPTATAVAAAAPFISRMMQASNRRRRIHQSASSIYQEHPELREDPHAERYFSAIADFAPDVAANPLVAGNVMKAMHQIGPGAVTPKMLKELLEVQDQFDKHQFGAADSLQHFSKLKTR